MIVATKTDCLCERPLFIDPAMVYLFKAIKSSKRQGGDKVHYITMALTFQILFRLYSRKKREDVPFMLQPGEVREVIPFLSSRQLSRILSKFRDWGIMRCDYSGHGRIYRNVWIDHEKIKELHARYSRDIKKTKRMTR